MKFRRILARRRERVYSVIAPGEKSKGRKADSLSKVFNNWNDTQYLLQLLLESVAEHNGNHDQDLSIDKVLDEILFDAERFEFQLRKIENAGADYANMSLGDLFKPLFKKVYVLQLEDLFSETDIDRTCRSKLRIYALKLKNRFFITSGSIRFSNHPESDLDEDVKWKLNEVCHFFKKKPVFDPWGLDEI